MQKGFFIGFDEELGGEVIRSSDGSYVLFKDGDMILKASGTLYLNENPAADNRP